MFESMHLGRPLGINLYVHGTFWLLPAFILFSGIASQGLALALVNVFVILALFACVALHELGHAMAARLFGIRTREITLYPIGGVARLERMPRRPLHEIIVALAGPAVNVAIVAFLLPLMILDGLSIEPLGTFTSSWELFWNQLLWGNVALVIFNMIPAFPMDGGRVLRALLASVLSRQAATDIAAGLGAAFAALFFLGGLLGDVSPMLMILGVFLFLAGRAERNAVQAEEEERRYRARYGSEETLPRVFVFGQPSDLHRADTALNGWVYDAKSGYWVLYQHGVPIRKAPAY